jgi:hypothetical protein
MKDKPTENYQSVKNLIYRVIIFHPEISTVFLNDINSL